MTKQFLLLWILDNGKRSHHFYDDAFNDYMCCEEIMVIDSECKDSLDPIHAAIEWISVLEGVIKECGKESCPSSFEVRFCHSNELVDVLFNSKSMKVIYVESSGQYVVCDWPIGEFISWLNTEGA